MLSGRVLDSIFIKAMLEARPDFILRILLPNNDESAISYSKIFKYSSKQFLPVISLIISYILS